MYTNTFLGSYGEFSIKIGFEIIKNPDLFLKNRDFVLYMQF